MPPIRNRPVHGDQRAIFEEPWKTCGLGPFTIQRTRGKANQQDWDDAAVNRLIGDSLVLRRLQRLTIQRSMHFSGSFPMERRTTLNIDHLQALLIQSRGAINVDHGPCHRCIDPKMRVFDECVSVNGFVYSACAGDVWHKKGSNCAYN